MRILNIIKFLIILFLFPSCNHKQNAISPESKNITESVYASGIIKSKNQYEVFSQLNGILEKVYVTEGMHIKKGDSLFQIDNENYKYTAENARLASVVNDYDSNAEKLKFASEVIRLAEKKLLHDSLLFTRQKSLWENNIGTRVDFEQKELNYENSKVDLERAKTNYEDLKRQLTFASAQSRNNLLMARTGEDNLIIKSEVDGVVYKINKELGELVSTISPLAVIGGDEFIVELNVDEYDIVKIRPGQQVILRMDSYNNQVFEARIISVYPMMNERTRTFKVDAEFVKKPDVLLLNLSLEANIVVAIKNNALTIPRSYLLNDSSVVLENGAEQKVITGLIDDSRVEIISGLRPDSKIILPAK